MTRRAALVLHHYRTQLLQRLLLASLALLLASASCATHNCARAWRVRTALCTFTAALSAFGLAALDGRRGARLPRLRRHHDAWLLALEASAALLLTHALLAEPRLLALPSVRAGVLAAALAALVAHKVLGAAALSALEDRLGVTRVPRHASLATSRSAAALSLGADSGRNAAAVTAEALRSAFPGAAAQAVALLSDDGNSLARLEVAAASEEARTALRAALQACAHGLAAPGADGRGDAVALVCAAPASGSRLVADSADWGRGVAAFPDWAAAAAGGCPAGRFITARLAAGDTVLGFLVLAFPRGAGHGFTHAALRDFCAALGPALAVRRTTDAAAAVSAQHHASLALLTHDHATVVSEAAALAVDVFPQHLVASVAARARRRDSVERRAIAPALEGTPEDLMADTYEGVTCIFADVCGYTRIAGLVSPEEAMQLLDRLFLRFDTLAEEHQVYKVETVGDAYFAVCGMLPPRADHARVALRFALDLHAAAAATLLPDAALAAGGGALLPHVQIRVGLHTGPVSSGVIGHLRARFCVFGDAVNVASRMESTGRADCVQLSAATYDAMALPELALPLTHLDVKGKGVLGVYMLCAFTADTSRVRALLEESSPLPPHSPLCLSPLAPSSPAAFRRARTWLGADHTESPGAARDSVGANFRRRSMERSRRSSVASDGGAMRRSFSEPVYVGAALRAAATPRLSRLSRAWDAVPAAPCAAIDALSALAMPRMSSHGAAVAALFALLVVASTPGAALAQGAPLLLRLATLLAVAHAAVELPRLLRPRAAPCEPASVVLARLHAALAIAGGEADILLAGCDAAMALLPGVLACALGVFAEGVDGAVVSWLECGGDAAAQRALAAALPARVSSQEDSGSSSVARVCAPDAGAQPLDSRREAGGMSACPDWAAARAAGLHSKHAVTLKLSAGLVTVGFMQLHFGLFAAHAPADDADAAALLALSEAISGAVFVRRAFAINRDAAVTSASWALDSQPLEDRPHATTPRADAVAAAAGALTDAAMMQALDESVAADAKVLLTWDLDAWALSDTDVSRLSVAMLHSEGLLRRFSIQPSALATFVDCVASGYNDNPFHNFRHAFMVQHACWLFLTDPAVRGLLDDLDCLALLLSAICHDLEHPGLTNAYQVNSGSELALRYNDTSVLEHHHTAVAFATIERAGILAHLKDSEYKPLRKLIVSAILATDMGVHKDLLARVVLRATRDAVHGAGSGGFSRASTDDRSLLVCFLLHCADLSNPVLPPELSRRIAAQLGREFARQAEMEQRALLPVTVMLAVDDVSTAKLELGFIDYVVSPLYVTLSVVAPKCGPRCLLRIAANRAMWNSVIAPSPRLPRSSAGSEPEATACVIVAHAALATVTAEAQRVTAAETASRAAAALEASAGLARERAQRQRDFAAAFAASAACASAAAGAAATAAAETQRVAAAATATSAKFEAAVIDAAASAAASATAKSVTANATALALAYVVSAKALAVSQEPASQQQQDDAAALAVSQEHVANNTAAVAAYAADALAAQTKAAAVAVAAGVEVRAVAVATANAAAAAATKATFIAGVAKNSANAAAAATAELVASVAAEAVAAATAAAVQASAEAIEVANADLAVAAAERVAEAVAGAEAAAAVKSAKGAASAAAAYRVSTASGVAAEAAATAAAVTAAAMAALPAAAALALFVASEAAEAATVVRKAGLADAAAAAIAVAFTADAAASTALVVADAAEVQAAAAEAAGDTANAAALRAAAVAKAALVAQEVTSTAAATSVAAAAKVSVAALEALETAQRVAAAAAATTEATSVQAAAAVVQAAAVAQRVAIAALTTAALDDAAPAAADAVAAVVARRVATAALAAKTAHAVVAAAAVAKATAVRQRVAAAAVAASDATKAVALAAAAFAAAESTRVAEAAAAASAATGAAAAAVAAAATAKAMVTAQRVAADAAAATAASSVLAAAAALETAATAQRVAATTYIAMAARKAAADMVVQAAAAPEHL